jgi:glycine cleavage system pyridoxal-binding protein P
LTRQTILCDGATAVAEAARFALRTNRKNKILISQDLLPEYIQIVKTCLENYKPKIIILNASENSTIEKNTVGGSVENDVEAIILRLPSFFGAIEDGVHRLFIRCHKKQELVVYYGGKSLTSLFDVFMPSAKDMF